MTGKLVERVHAINWNRLLDAKDLQVRERLTVILVAGKDSALQRPGILANVEFHRAADDDPGVHRFDPARHRAGDGGSGWP